MENLEEEIKKISKELDELSKDVKDIITLRDSKNKELRILKEKKELKEIYGLNINEIISLVFKEYNYTIFSDRNFFYIKSTANIKKAYIDQIDKIYHSYNNGKRDFYISTREQSICLYFDLNILSLKDIIRLFNIEINDHFINEVSKELNSLNKRAKLIEDLGLIFL